ncbi:MAG: histidine kinase [Acidimicrobiales bacterium]
MSVAVFGGRDPTGPGSPPANARRRLPDLANPGAYGLGGLAVFLAGGSLGLHLVNGATGLTHWWVGTTVIGAVLVLPGTLLARRCPTNPIGWLMLAAATAEGLCGVGREYGVRGALAGPLPFSLTVAWVADSLWIAAFGALPLILQLFPDGRPLSRRWRPLIPVSLAAMTLGWTVSVLTPGTVEIGGQIITTPAQGGPPGVLVMAGTMVSSVLIVLVLFASAVSVVLRYHRSQGETRLQVEWVAFAGVLAAAELGSELLPSNPVAPYTGPVAVALLTGAIVLAVLRYRLYHIDLVVNRTLVYASLTILLAGAYLGTVSLFGHLVRETNELGPALLATAVVAVALAPLRQRLQAAADRLMYGDLHDPYRVISALGQRLGQPGPPGPELDVVVRTITQVLRLPYAAIEDPDGEMVTAWGRPMGNPLSLPLAFRGKPVGRLMVETRSPLGRFARSERRLLEDLARQAAAAVHSVTLSHDLQRSRERLVGAKEEERRRLRRDLHDGLGPKLAAIGLELDGLQRLVAGDNGAAVRVLTDLKDHLRTTIDDIRQLVYDLRPPALDELGLTSAISERALQLEEAAPAGLRISVEASGELAGLPAAVEVAAYWITMEAMTNVVRHSGATCCTVRLERSAGLTGEGLAVEVDDDGRGLPAGWRPGVGTGSMVERAGELGGTCTVGPDQVGTQVRAWLPLSLDGGHR